LRGHDPLAVKDILHRVLSLTFFENSVRRNSLRESERRHGVRLDKLVVGGCPGEDEMRSDPGFELANAFECAFAELRRRRSVLIGRSAKDDDGVEVAEVGIPGGDASIEEGRATNQQGGLEAVCQTRCELYV
jgi:hypothetical protein